VLRPDRLPEMLGTRTAPPMLRPYRWICGRSSPRRCSPFRRPGGGELPEVRRVRPLICLDYRIELDDNPEIDLNPE